jgi:ferredoxin
MSASGRPVARGTRVPSPRSSTTASAGSKAGRTDGAMANLMAMGRRTALELKVNPIDCVGHGMCAELFPEWITLDDWGYPIIDARPIPPHLHRHAKRAADACPTLALHLRRIERG